MPGRRTRSRVEPILEAVTETLRAARDDSRIGARLLEGISAEWQESLEPWRRR